MMVWNPWHGCRKKSEGCLNCYMFRRDEQFGRDSTIIKQTGEFNLPLIKSKRGGYKINCLDNPVYVCMTSDFFIEEADKWRDYIWSIIRYRKDLEFKIITKRIERFYDCIPEDWGSGYHNVTIISTCENQIRADERLPVLLEIPAVQKEIIHEPMLERIDTEKYLSGGKIECVTCGGESGDNARVCDYSWILDMREQCVRNNVSFVFKQTGAHFRMDGKEYHIAREYQMRQAKKADIDFQRAIENDSIGETYSGILMQLSKSKFRGHFTLPFDMRKYCREKGLDTVKTHAFDFIRERLAPAVIDNDGKQTPMHGHPVFIAQHATATCCRDCLQKWHYIPKGRKLTESEIIYVVGLIMEWIKKDLEKYNKDNQ